MGDSFFFPGEFCEPFEPFFGFEVAVGLSCPCFMLGEVGAVHVFHWVFNFTSGRLLSDGSVKFLSVYRARVSCLVK